MASKTSTKNAGQTKSETVTKRHADVSGRPLYEPRNTGSINPQIIRDAVYTVVSERKSRVAA